MVLSMFFKLVLANCLFSLRDISLTLGLLPPRRHVVYVILWVLGVLGQGKNQGARIFFHQSLISGCYAILTSPKEDETAVYGYNSALF